MITGATRIAAVIGWPVEHSRSPQMFEAAFRAAGIDAVMIPIGVAPESFAAVIAALRAMHALGASITLPHKLAAAAACDELSQAAREIGAVNCIHVAGEHLVGHNTDCDGFVDNLTAAGCELGGKRCVILGAGGAARAVAYGLRVARCAVEVVARRPETVGWATAWPWTTDQLRECFARGDLVVDATPIGLANPSDEAALVDALPLDALHSASWVTTLVYHRSTILLERARRNGHSTVDGRGMLVHQAARAFAIWTGASAPIDVMIHALDDALGGT